MTNFSSNKKNIITPEKSLLFIPIIIGVLFSSSVLSLVYRPLIQRLSTEKAQIKVLEDKIFYIPLYKKYINQISINTSKAKKQQGRLIDLISDPQELDTILSEINRICIDNELEIINIVPQPIVKFNQLKDSKSKTLQTNNSPNSDPFLIPAIEKHIFKLSLKGDFKNLLDFLKEIELLQAITISDKIEIKANSNNENLKLTMSFNLTTYGRIENKK